MSTKYESSSSSEIDGPLSRRGVPLKQNGSTEPTHRVLDHHSTDRLHVSHKRVPGIDFHNYFIFDHGGIYEYLMTAT